ncbi:MAG: FHA domain-containing protein [Wujia sp.]
MHLIKCKNEHIYDGDKFRSCPHCSTIAWDGSMVMEDISIDQTDVDTEIPEDEKRQKYEQIGRRKTVGVLICVEGEMTGEGFLLREGENVIGRASNMDIPLIHDLTVSRKNHAIINYDIGRGECYLINPEASEIYVNGKRLQKKALLANHDRIQIGAQKFVMIEAEGIWTQDK